MDFLGGSGDESFLAPKPATLGERLGTFRHGRVYGFVFVALGIPLAILGVNLLGTGIMLAWARDPQFLLLLPAGVLDTAVSAAVAYFGYRLIAKRLDVFEQGLLRRGLWRSETLWFADVREFQAHYVKLDNSGFASSAWPNFTRWITPRPRSGREYVLTIRQQSGEDIHISRHAAPNGREAIHLIGNQIGKLWLPQTLRALRHGLAVQFGPLEANSQGIANSDSRLPWNVVLGISVDPHGQVIAATPGGPVPIAADFNQVVNLALLSLLPDALRKDLQRNTRENRT